MTMQQHPVYEVHHAKDMMAMVDPITSKPVWRQRREEGFTHVADVQAPLEAVFRLTHHLGEGCWVDTPEVVWSDADAKRRLPSVGDVLRMKGTERVWLISHATLEEFSPQADTDDPAVRGT